VSMIGWIGSLHNFCSGWDLGFKNRVQLWGQICKKIGLFHVNVMTMYDYVCTIHLKKANATVTSDLDGRLIYTTSQKHAKFFLVTIYLNKPVRSARANLLTIFLRKILALSSVDLTIKLR